MILEKLAAPPFSPTKTGREIVATTSKINDAARVAEVKSEAGALIEIPHNTLQTGATPVVTAVQPKSGLDRFFGITANGSNVRTEVIAGVTSFFASVFTILSIPNMVSGGAAQDPQLWNAVFIAAALAAVLGCMLKAFLAKLPFVQAPGMGLGSYFAGAVMPGLATLAWGTGVDMADPAIRQAIYPVALLMVLVSGLLFVLFTATGIRDRIINGIPTGIKMSLGPGIGLFITLLGLRFSGIVVGSPGTFVALRNFSDLGSADAAVHAATLGAVLAVLGFLLISVLHSLKVRGAILIGILAVTVVTYLPVVGNRTFPENFSFNLGTQFTDWADLAFVSMFRTDYAAMFAGTGTARLIVVMLGMVLAFTLVNMLDALGTIFGIASSAGMTDERGDFPGLRKGLLADAVGTTTGSFLGSPTVTTVVSSATGIGQGGRTGLTALVAGALFAVSILLAPFITLIPNHAVGPALIFVGFLMIGKIREVDFSSDPSEGIPAFLTLAMMPLAFSIADGIAFGLISYIVIKLFSGRIREVKVTAAVIALLFALHYFI